MYFIRKNFLIVLSLLVVLTFGCERESSIPFPSLLKGIWVTDNIKYQNRYIEIDEHTLVFGIGGDKSHTFFIDRIKKNIKGSMEEWILSCQDEEGTSFEYVFLTENKSDGTLLTMKNMGKIIWYKVEE